MKSKGYIFDYGGTLDTGGCHWGKMLWHAYERAAVPVTEQQFREAYVVVERLLGKNPIVKPDFTFRQTLATKVGLQLQQLELHEEVGSRIVDDLYAQVRLHTSHAREVIRQLKEPKVLVSNFYGNMPTVLREMGLDRLFETVIESAVVGIRKPDPQIFLLGVETLGLLPAEVTVVGDSIEKDMVPAHRAGCQTVWLRGEQWTDGPVDTAAVGRTITNLLELTNN